jgi:hypothetical protein
MEYHLPVIVKIKRENGQIAQGCDVYIGRRCSQGGWNLKDSIWGNPYPVKTYGRDLSVQLYELSARKTLTEQQSIVLPEYIKLLSTERPIVLGCWCKRTPGVKCHGDIILKICKEFIDQLRVKPSGPFVF